MKRNLSFFYCKTVVEKEERPDHLLQKEHSNPGDAPGMKKDRKLHQKVKRESKDNFIHVKVVEATEITD